LSAHFIRGEDHAQICVRVTGCAGLGISGLWRRRHASTRSRADGYAGSANASPAHRCTHCDVRAADCDARAADGHSGAADPYACGANEYSSITGLDA